MTGYSASGLEGLKKKMVHDAIKTTMRMEPTNWDGDAESGFYGMSWEGKLPPVDGPTGTVKLKWRPPGLGMSAGFPPGAKKTGEGYDAANQPYIEYEIDPWTSIYQPWVERIDTAFEGWDNLPDPGDFADPISKLQAAVSALIAVPHDDGGGGTNDPNGDFGSPYNSVELASHFSVLDKFIDPAQGNSGLLIYNFYEAYSSRVAGVMANQAQAAMVLGVSLLAEQKIWEGARKDIMKIADKASGAFKYGGIGGDGISLDTILAFADLVDVFAPPQVKTAISAGKAVVNLVEPLLPKKPKGDDSVKLEGYWPDEVYESLVQCISDLEQRIFDMEYEVAYTTIAGMIGDMHSLPATDFHIHPEKGIDAELANSKKLDVKIESLKMIGYDICPKISAYMGHAAEDALGGNKQAIYYRENQIGLGVYGPYDKWAELQGLFDEVTTGSAKEFVEAGKILAIGAGWIEDTDGLSQKALTGVQDDLDRGQNGWDNTVPTVPTGPGGMYGPY